MSTYINSYGHSRPTNDNKQYASEIAEETRRRNSRAGTYSRPSDAPEKDLPIAQWTNANVLWWLEHTVKSPPHVLELVKQEEVTGASLNPNDIEWTRVYLMSIDLKSGTVNAILEALKAFRKPLSLPSSPAKSSDITNSEEFQKLLGDAALALVHNGNAKKQVKENGTPKHNNGSKDLKGNTEQEKLLYQQLSSLEERINELEQEKMLNMVQMKTFTDHLNEAVEQKRKEIEAEKESFVAKMEDEKLSLMKLLETKEVELQTKLEAEKEERQQLYKEFEKEKAALIQQKEELEKSLDLQGSVGPKSALVKQYLQEKEKLEQKETQHESVSNLRARVYDIFKRSKDINKPTEFQLAIDINDWELVDKFLSEGADINASTALGCPPIYNAAFYGEEDTVKELLKRKCNPNVVNNDMDQWTPLHVAASQGHLNIVKLLLEAGGNKDQLSADSTTPLCQAATNGRIAVVAYLIEQGANIDLGSVQPIHAACFNEHHDIIELLTTSGAQLDVPCTLFDGYYPIHILIASEQKLRPKTLKHIQLMIEKGAPLDAKTKQGLTALHLAALYNQYRVAKLLVKHHARADIRNKRNRTALDIANLYSGREKISKLLSEYCPEVASSSVSHGSKHKKKEGFRQKYIKQPVVTAPKQIIIANVDEDKN